MAKKAESRLQLKIRKALEKEVGGKWRKVHGSMFQGAGEPDLDGVVDGFSFKFEVKIPCSGKPSAIQLETMEDWRKVGAISCIVESPAQAITLVKAIKATPSKRRKGRKLYRWICLTLRAAYGENMGYGRRPRGRKEYKPRRAPDWAVNQLKVNMGKVHRRKVTPLYGVP